MDIGMLWFDNDKQSDLPSKIESAAEYYLTKYGIRPNVCFVHPSMTPQDIGSHDKKPNRNKNDPKANKGSTLFKAGSIDVRTSKSMLPNHLWIGINGTKQ